MIKKRLKLCFALTLITTILCACELVVEPGEGGSVSLLSDGSECLSGESCEFETENGFFDTFVAAPAEGYQFFRWVGYGPCEEDTTGICEVMLEALPVEITELVLSVQIILQAQFKFIGVNYDDSVNYDDGINYNYTTNAALDSAMKGFYSQWERTLASN